MSYLQKKPSKKRDQSAHAPKAATADSPEAKTNPQPRGTASPSRSFFGRRSGTR